MCVVAIYLFISSINQTKQTSNNFCIIHRSFSAALKLSKPTVIRDECSKSSETRKINRKPRKMSKIDKQNRQTSFKSELFQRREVPAGGRACECCRVESAGCEHGGGAAAAEELQRGRGHHPRQAGHRHQRRPDRWTVTIFWTVGVPTRACPFTLQNLWKPYQQARRFNNHSLYTKKIFIDGC